MRIGIRILTAGLALQLTLPVFVAPAGAQQPSADTTSILPPTRLPAPEPGVATNPSSPAPVASVVFPEGFPNLPAQSSESQKSGAVPSVAAAPYPATKYAELHAPNTDYGSNDDYLDGPGEAPGVYDYWTFSSILPDYYYRAEYYNTPGIGAQRLPIMRRPDTRLATTRMRLACQSLLRSRLRLGHRPKRRARMSRAA